MTASGDGADRGVSEAVGVATLFALTLLLTATVGIGVLFIEPASQQGINGNFSFEYLGEGAKLLVTFEEGDDLEAGRILVSGPLGEVTWAESSGYNASRIVAPGDAIQVGENGPYGGAVRQIDEFTVAYSPQSGNRTVLDTWGAGV